MQASYFFVCGTPSDREGFRYHCLDGDRLPGDPASYLDRVTEVGKEGVVAVDLISADSVKLVLFIEYRAIQPNDRDYNRGAYIAAGFLSHPDPEIHSLSNSIARVNEILGALTSMLDQRGAFPKDFKIENFSHTNSRSKLNSLSPYFLADLMLQASNSVGAFTSDSSRIVLDPSTSSLNATIESLSFYNKPHNERLIEEFGTEIEAAARKVIEAELSSEKAKKQLDILSKEVEVIEAEFAKYKAEKNDIHTLQTASQERGANIESNLNRLRNTSETDAPTSYQRASSSSEAPPFKTRAILNEEKANDGDSLYVFNKSHSAPSIRNLASTSSGVRPPSKPAKKRKNSQKTTPKSRINQSNQILLWYQPNRWWAIGLLVILAGILLISGGYKPIASLIGLESEEPKIISESENPDDASTELSSTEKAKSENDVTQQRLDL